MPQPTDAEMAAALADAVPQTNRELLAALSDRSLALATVWRTRKRPAPPQQRKPKRRAKPKQKRRRRRPETERERFDRLRRESVRAKIALIREQQAEERAEWERLGERERRYNRMMDAFAAARLARDQAREYSVTCAGINHRLGPVADDLAYDGWAALGRPPTEDC